MKYLIAASLFSIQILSFSQISDSIQISNYENKINYSKYQIGIGMGLDYGGIVGLNFTACPTKNINLFAGFGHAKIDLGYNVGVKVYPFRKKDSFVSLYLIWMYGYNTIIQVKNSEDLSKMFYGYSFGAGLDFNTKRRPGNWTLCLILPVRDSEVNEYQDYLERFHNVRFENALMPLLLSFGYKFYL